MVDVVMLPRQEKNIRMHTSRQEAQTAPKIERHAIG